MNTADVLYLRLDLGHVIVRIGSFPGFEEKIVLFFLVGSFYGTRQ